jgi:hypothetical protein
MNQSSLQRLPEEVAEIEKHKYFLSQKAGYDVGWEAAEQDWVSSHAEQFRASMKPERQTSSIQPASTTAEAKEEAAAGFSSLVRRLLSKAGLKRSAA